MRNIQTDMKPAKLSWLGIENHSRPELWHMLHVIHAWQNREYRLKRWRKVLMEKTVSKKDSIFGIEKLGSRIAILRSFQFLLKSIFPLWGKFWSKSMRCLYQETRIHITVLRINKRIKVSLKIRADTYYASIHKLSMQFKRHWYSDTTCDARDNGEYELFCEFCSQMEPVLCRYGAVCVSLPLKWCDHYISSPKVKKMKRQRQLLLKPPFAST